MLSFSFRDFYLKKFYYVHKSPLILFEFYTDCFIFADSSVTAKCIVELRSGSGPGPGPVQVQSESNLKRSLKISEDLKR